MAGVAPAAAPRSSGMAAAVVSAAAFGSSGSFATSLLHAGWSPVGAVAARLAVAALALAVPAAVALRRQPRRPPERRGPRGWRGWTVVLYGVVPVAGCQLCYFEAVSHLSVAVALLLEYSGTLLVVGWMWLRHRQAPSGLTVGGAVAAVAGLALVLDLVGDHHLSAVGVLWGLGAALGLAVYFVASSHTDEALPAIVVAGGGMGVGAVAMLVVGALGVLPLHASSAPVRLAGAHVSWLVPLLGVGLLAAAFAYVTGIAAARALGARLSSFVGLAEVLFATLYAWVLLGQRLTGVQLVGGALVVAGIALVRLGEPAAPVGDGDEVGEVLAAA